MTPEESHQHSLITLGFIEQLDDYLSGVETVCDMGAGIGLDSVFWANLKDPNGRDRNIKVTAVEIAPAQIINTVKNMEWKFADFSKVELPPQDIIWAHDVLQLAADPIGTLFHWHTLLRTDGLLLIEIPYLLSVHSHVERLKVDVNMKAGTYHIYTLSNLIAQLASAGFDCRQAHFHLDRQSGWIRAAVYRTEAEPKLYNSWYELAETGRLPYSLDDVIQSANRFNETDLVVEWLDRSVTILKI